MHLTQSLPLHTHTHTHTLTCAHVRNQSTKCTIAHSHHIVHSHTNAYKCASSVCRQCMCNYTPFCTSSPPAGHPCMRAFKACVTASLVDIAHLASCPFFCSMGEFSCGRLWPLACVACGCSPTVGRATRLAFCGACAGCEAAVRALRSSCGRPLWTPSRVGLSCDWQKSVQ